MENIKLHTSCAKYPQKRLWRDEISMTKFYFITWFIAMVIVSLTFYLVEGTSWIYIIFWTLAWTSVIIWSVFLIVLIYWKMLRLRRKICYNYIDKKIIIIGKRNSRTVLEVGIKDIQKIITSPYDDGPTQILSDRQITPWTGISLSLQYAGGEFGRMLGEEFKKYWESKGYDVSVKKRKSWLFGDRIVYERGDKYYKQLRNASSK